MRPSFRDMYGALPTVRYNISTLNPMGLLLLATLFLSGCITVMALVTVYRWLF